MKHFMRKVTITLPLLALAATLSACANTSPSMVDYTYVPAANSTSSVVTDIDLEYF